MTGRKVLEHSDTSHCSMNGDVRGCPENSPTNEVKREVNLSGGPLAPNVAMITGKGRTPVCPTILSLEVLLSQGEKFPVHTLQFAFKVMFEVLAAWGALVLSHSWGPVFLCSQLDVL